MRILFFFGTRPEAIKLAPLIRELRQDAECFDVRVCVSAQHREMLDQVLDFFEIQPDYDFNIMKSNQDLFDITVNALKGLKSVLSECVPDWLVVQGDTTSTFVGALAAFYAQAPVAHVEAGLRSFRKDAPFPEEMNRVLTARLADLHFAPTEKARKNLLRESVPDEDVFVVGNTGIDALFWCRDRVASLPRSAFPELESVPWDRPILLVTAHRRESFGAPFRGLCEALRELALSEDVSIVYPVHRNPNVRRPVFQWLEGIPNVHLLDPLDYPALVRLMDRSRLILTDSGGIQEEAPSLGKPVLVLREVTERTEGVEAGTARLVGTDPRRILGEVRRLLKDPQAYEAMARAVNPYGDGKASQRIKDILVMRGKRAFCRPSPSTSGEKTPLRKRS